MMKTLNDYMAMSYRMEIVEDKDEGGFVVFYPDLPSLNNNNCPFVPRSTQQC